MDRSLTDELRVLPKVHVCPTFFVEPLKLFANKTVKTVKCTSYFYGQNARTEVSH